MRHGQTGIPDSPSVRGYLALSAFFADHLTSESSHFPYNADMCEKFVKILDGKCKCGLANQSCPRMLILSVQMTQIRIRPGSPVCASLASSGPVSLNPLLARLWNAIGASDILC